MPLISRRREDEKTTVRVTASITLANMRTLERYATFLGEPVGTKEERRETFDRIFNEAIAGILATDKEFKAETAPKATPVRKRAMKSDPRGDAWKESA